MLSVRNYKLPPRMPSFFYYLSRNMVVVQVITNILNYLLISNGFSDWPVVSSTKNSTTIKLNHHNHNLNKIISLDQPHQMGPTGYVNQLLPPDQSEYSDSHQLISSSQSHKRILKTDQLQNKVHTGQSQQHIYADKSQHQLQIGQSNPSNSQSFSIGSLMGSRSHITTPKNVHTETFIGHNHHQTRNTERDISTNQFKSNGQDTEHFTRRMLPQFQQLPRTGAQERFHLSSFISNYQTTSRTENTGAATKANDLKTQTTTNQQQHRDPNFYNYFISDQASQPQTFSYTSQLARPSPTTTVLGNFNSFVNKQQLQPALDVTQSHDVKKPDFSYLLGSILENQPTNRAGRTDTGQTESIPELSDEVESDGNDITTDTSNTNELSTAKVKETQEKVNKLALDGRVKISLADLDLFRQQVLKQYQNNQLIVRDTTESNSNNQTPDNQSISASNIFSSLSNSRHPSNNSGTPVFSSNIPGFSSGHSVSNPEFSGNNAGYKPAIPGLSSNQAEYPDGPLGFPQTQSGHNNVLPGFNQNLPEENQPIGTGNYITTNNDDTRGYIEDNDYQKEVTDRNELFHSFNDLLNNDFEGYNELDDERENLPDNTLEYDNNNDLSGILNDSPETSESTFTNFFLNLFQYGLNSVPEVKDNGDITTTEQNNNVKEQDLLESKSQDERSNLPLGSFSNWLSNSQSLNSEPESLQPTPAYRLPDFFDTGPNNPSSQRGALSLPADSMNRLPSFLTSQRNNHNVQSGSSQHKTISQSKLPLFLNSQSNPSNRQQNPSNIHAANERGTDNIKIHSSMGTRLDFKENFRGAQPLIGFLNHQVIPTTGTNKQKKSKLNLFQSYFPNRPIFSHNNNKIKDNYLHNNLVRFSGLKRFLNNSSRKET